MILSHSRVTFQVMKPLSKRGPQVMKTCPQVMEPEILGALGKETARNPHWLS